MRKIIFFLIFTLVINESIELSKEHIIPNLQISKDEAKSKVINALRKSGSKIIYKFPEKYKNYVTDLTSSTKIQFNQILHSQIDNLKRTHNFPDNIIKIFRALKYVKNNSIIRQTKYDPHSIRKSLDDEYKTFPTLIYTKDNIAIIFDSSESSWEYRYLKVKINTNYEGIDLTLEVPEGSVTAIDCISPNLDEAFKYAYEVSGIVIKIKDYIEGYNNYLTSGIENKGHNKK